MGSSSAYFRLVVLTMIWTVFFRFGLLSIPTGASMGKQLIRLPITFDLSAWHAGVGGLTLPMILP